MYACDVSWEVIDEVIDNVLGDVLGDVIIVYILVFLYQQSPPQGGCIVASCVSCMVTNFP